MMLYMMYFTNVFLTDLKTNVLDLEKIRLRNQALLLLNLV